jgi:hypothetical protein
MFRRRILLLLSLLLLLMMLMRSLPPSFHQLPCLLRQNLSHLRAWTAPSSAPTALSTRPLTERYPSRLPL